MPNLFSPQNLLPWLFATCFGVKVWAGERPDSLGRFPFNFHFQQTTIYQEHPAFGAQYTGPGSLQAHEEGQTSLTSTLFFGLQPWKGGEFYFNPEIAGGSGLSGARGIAGFTNGETFRIGNPSPQIYVARCYLRQVLWSSGTGSQAEDQANQLPVMNPEKQLYVAFGKMSTADFFDNNRYSHDPRTQFLNWSLMSAGAWDYPANTRGYTWNLVAGLQLRRWAFRMATSMVPHTANGPVLDARIGKAHSETAEIQYSYGARKGCLRLLVFRTQTRMASYNQTLQQATLDQSTPDLATNRQYGRTKMGFGLNWEHPLTDYMGLFARASWNDGRNETWAFTEIDQSVHLGFFSEGVAWKRPDDDLGVALVANGISTPHRRYLQAGGQGFMLGDGALSYRPEFIAEVFYSIMLHDDHFFLTPDYQFVVNPGYNQARGPVHVLSLRMHARF